MQSNRGRGRGVPPKNVWATRTEAQRRETNQARSVNQDSSNNESQDGGSNSTRKFEDACAQIQANVKRHVQKLALDGSDEDSSDESDDKDSDIISSVLNAYASTNLDVSKTQQLIKDSLRSGVASCLICISSIKKNDPIWSCRSCFCGLHLTCIQRWAKDSIYFQCEAANERLSPGEVVDPKKFNWCCPKCRAEYPQPSIPTHYYCYCGKARDPNFDPWLVPHSCGSTCSKQLKNCNHTCLLLCHPGPCPPCPKMIAVTCHCGNSQPQMQRCSSQAWGCGKACSRLLSCNHHHCQKPCHVGDCPPCSKKSMQKCLCGSKKEERSCEMVKFQCDKVCSKKLACGHHNCEVVCHSGDCPPCPRSLQRTCPCGKTTSIQHCTMEVGTCGDTCGKLLECGIHKCVERCHKSACGTCLQMRFKRCRCGLKEKELPCYKEFHCDTKCKRIKDCRRHPCNRKCCPGTCPPCDQQCNRPLGCKNHKCASRCHQGPCYPCALTVDVTCACGKTVVRVPCGSERHTKPPKCSLPCLKPPNCHHPARTKHSCHFGGCPPCQQPCNKVARCSHVCKAPCHTSVLVEVAAPQVVRAGPWEPKLAPKMELRQLPCPPCQVPVPVTCLGGHETADWPCHMSVPSSCGRPCGRLLSCTNHTCTKPCHAVNDDQRNCEYCEQECSKQRPEGCNHPCTRGRCHPGPCPPCTKLVKRNCHCGLNPQLIRCNEWVDAIATGQLDIRNMMLSCKDHCPKLLKCGHRCPLNCHANDCPPETECAASVHVSCLCKRIKKNLACNVWQKQKTSLDCDDVCKRKKDQEQKVRTEKERLQREEEERRNRVELEQYQRKFERRRRDKRKEEVPKNSSSRTVYFRALIVVIPIVVALVTMLWIRP